MRRLRQAVREFCNTWGEWHALWAGLLWPVWLWPFLLWRIELLHVNGIAPELHYLGLGITVRLVLIAAVWVVVMA